MKIFCVVLALLSAVAVNGQVGQPAATSKVLCYFDGKATQRDGEILI